MRGATTVLLQMLVAAVGLAAIGGLVGFLIAHFAHKGGAAAGVGWGIVVAGIAVAFFASSSDGLSESLAGRAGGGSPNSFWFAWYYGDGSPLPQSAVQLVLGGLLALGAGVAMLFLIVY